MNVVEDKDTKDYWLLVHFLKFPDEKLMPKMGNYLPKVIVELGLEFEYFKSLLYSFHCFDYFDTFKLIRLANVLLHNIFF